MRNGQKFTNTFNGGQHQDIDKRIQKPNTYRYARNGSLLYNRDNESTQDGSGYSFCPAKGNKYVASLCNDYKICGHIDTRDGLILFSTNGQFSEIGMLTIALDASGIYVTIFNDQNDPNGDLLGFDYDEYISGFYVYENKEKERIYFAQRGKEKRVVNLALFYQGGIPVHSGSCGLSNLSYPKYMSVHAMSARMDLIFPDIYFKQRIEGQLKSGTYQAFMRYISEDGHESLFSPDTMPVFVTTERLDGEVNGVQDAYKTNHHNRTMGASNIMTTEGIRWIFDGIDTRWDYVEVGYIYHTSDLGFQEANIFERIKIESDYLEVDLLKHTGRPVSRGQLNQRMETILSVGETNDQDGRCIDADVEVLQDIEINTEAISISPKIRRYIPDSKNVPIFNEVNNPVSRRDDNDPITNLDVTTGTISVSRYTGKNKEYPVIDDYMSYKGQQFQASVRSHFRGETYPYALLLIDLKGNPLFAQHIQDYTFPELYDHGFELTEDDENGRTNIKILGALFNNIRFPEEKIRDKNGKLLISGFMIVRAERVKRILHQGILFPCVETQNCSTNTKNDAIVRPLSHIGNYFETDYGNSLSLPKDPISNDSHSYFGYQVFCRPKTEDDAIFEGRDSQNAYSSPFMATYHSPDILIEGSMRALEKTDEIKHVGQVVQKYAPQVPIRGTKHIYSKSYRTGIISNSTEQNRWKKGRPKVGDVSKMKLHFLHNRGQQHLYEQFDAEFPERSFSPLVGSDLNLCNRSEESFCSLQPNALVIKMSDIESVDLAENRLNSSSYRVFNYLQVPDSYYTEVGESSLEFRRYFPVGHFQRINEEVLSDVGRTERSDGGFDYVFNDVEVWGGDCYPSLFDFTRMYPVYSDGCEKICTGFLGLKDGNYPDYSISHVVPIESKYNLGLIYGRKFAANAVNPQATGCANEYENLSNGIMFEQPESWGYNKVLNVHETAYFYTSKPSDIEITPSRDSGFYWSPGKTYGEKNDSYRINYPGDTADVIGGFGRIVKLINAFNYLYVIQERAFGILLINSKTFLNTDSESIVISSGNVYSGVNYISKKYGTIHKNSIFHDGNMFGFVDVINGSVVRFSQNGVNLLERNNFDDLISKITINQNIISHGSQFKDIISGFDPDNNCLYVTFHSEAIKKTISYSQDLSSVVSEDNDFYPSYYAKRGRYMFSQKPGYSHVYVHGQGNYGNFYGEYFDTVLKFIVNPNYKFDCYFDNGFISIDSAPQRISRILHESRDSVHDLVFYDIDGGSIVKKDSRVYAERGKIAYPMHKKTESFAGNRLCGEILEITVFISNFQAIFDGNQEKVGILSFDTAFRPITPIR